MLFDLFVLGVSWGAVILEEIWCHLWIYHGVLYQKLESWSVLRFLPYFVVDYLEACHTHHMTVHHNIVKHVETESHLNKLNREQTNRMFDQLADFDQLEEFFEVPKRIYYPSLKPKALKKHEWTVREAMNGMGCFFAGMFLHGLSYIFSPICAIYLVVLWILPVNFFLHLGIHGLMILWNSACSCYMHKHFHYRDQWRDVPTWKRPLFFFSKEEFETIQKQHLTHHKFPAFNFSVSPYSSLIESLLGCKK